ncbi:MAG: hypothetical protein JST52_05125 [Bacteroidetes bacterium]|nr:hypothetical protein [Bacteroidota bacterium]MBS1740543.1 hypothetical protein [Bacteroidota bacterium]
MKQLTRNPFLLLSLLLLPFSLWAQNATVKARIDASQITVGDQARLWIEATHAANENTLQWATIPDTFNSLEIVHRSKIDTVSNGNQTTYKQQLLVTGFDSGSFKIPAFQFSILPKNGTPYLLATDSFQLLVQTIPVDTTQPFKGIKDIMVVKRTWQDYIGWIVGGALLLGLIAVVVYYFLKHKKADIPKPINLPTETVQEKALRLFSELEQRKLWQSGKEKEYYVELSDILRSYLEERFKIPALEFTTDEILSKARFHPEMRNYYDALTSVLYISDLAKFAKAQPTPQEHLNAMEQSKAFVKNTPIIVSPNPDAKP